MIEDKLEKTINEALKKLGIKVDEVHLEHPTDFSHGDYSTNVALVAGVMGLNNSRLHGASDGQARELSNEIVDELKKNLPEEVDRVEIAGSGFINFHLSREFFTESIENVNKDFGKNTELKGSKIMVEYTDPNPFKEFHIGHLMSNAIGESISRLIEFSGADVKRANYQGDVGLHVAKALWGKLKNPGIGWGEAYVLGSKSYDENKKEIDELNKNIYEKSDVKVMNLYEEGKQESLGKFEKIYEKLGTKFDFYFFESESSEPGKKLVEEYSGDVFVESDGAMIFHEKKSELHTRVFLNSQGLPTYEAKELGLAKIKYDKYPYDISVVITGNEINEYFRVVHKAMEFVYPDLAEKTKHIGHGMMLGPDGKKMSSRTGDVTAAKSFIDGVKVQVLERMDDKDETVAEQVAVGAIKYSILKQAIGGDIIFDTDKSLSFEGDSGPYLQYTYVRALSLLEKGRNDGISLDTKIMPDEITSVERILYRFPEVVKRALDEYTPHYVVTFLTELAGHFNSYYAKEQIVNAEDKYSPYKLTLTNAVAVTLKNGLWLLGIKVPERM